MKKLLSILAVLAFAFCQSQTYYSQDFDIGGFNGWTGTDLDGDGNGWYLGNYHSVSASYGYGSLASNSSWVPAGSATGLNNLITSPLMDLSPVTGSNLYLLYDLATSSSWPAEKYSVYVTTVNTPSGVTSSVPVYTETVASGGAQKRAINLTPFIGQQVYISFRHYDCYDQFYLVIDNIEIKTLPTVDFSLKKIELSKYGVINTDYFIKTTVKNNGSQPISSINMSWNDGTLTHNAVMPLSAPINPGLEGTVIHSVPVKYASLVEKNITVTVNQANGMNDSNTTDNSLTAPFKTLSQFSPKKVLVEEGTGTWCGWCPRGIVAMANLDANYANHFIGIAVHNNDPMKVDEYDSGANIAAFPGFNVDRVVLQEFLQGNIMEELVIARKDLIAPVQLGASGSFSGNTLTLTASAVFRTYFNNANFRLAAVLTEDNVKGTTLSYGQNNYFSGGGNGPMGGFENLPGTVPASQMSYNHVGRMLLGGYAGQPGSVPSSIADGQVASYTFNAVIPSSMNVNKLKAIVLLLDAATGEVINARSFVVSTLGTSDVETDKNYLTLYPNPTTDFFKIQSNDITDLKMYDAGGRLVMEKYRLATDTPVSVRELAGGTYLVQITEKGSQPVTKKLIVKK